jgi:hypothetical protein
MIVRIDKFNRESNTVSVTIMIGSAIYSRTAYASLDNAGNYDPITTKKVLTTYFENEYGSVNPSGDVPASAKMVPDLWYNLGALYRFYVEGSGQVTFSITKFDGSVVNSVKTAVVSGTPKSIIHYFGGDAKSVKVSVTDTASVTLKNS